MANKKNLIIGMLSILLFFGIVIYLSLLATTGNDTHNKKLKQASDPKNSYSQQDKKTSLFSDDEIKLESAVTNNYIDPSGSSKKRKYFKPSNLRKIPGALGVTEKELATLHEEQMRVIEERLHNPDEIVIPPSEDGLPGITRGEMTALHEEQMRVIEERLHNPNEIVVPPSEDGFPGISRGEVTVLHEVQMRVIEERLHSPDEIVVQPSEDGLPGITRGEMIALHEEQMWAIEMRLQDLDEIIVPPSEEGQQGITRLQLLDLHDKQMENLDLENSF
jgi:hypothetical protein